MSYAIGQVWESRAGFQAVVDEVRSGLVRYHSRDFTGWARPDLADREATEAVFGQRFPLRQAHLDREVRP